MLPRHSLAWLSDEGWQMVCKDASQEAGAAISQWRQANRPAVVRRADADAGDDVACIGIALPPDPQGIKKRIPLRVPLAHIHQVMPPLRIDAVLAAVPQAWHRPLATLDAQAAGQGLFFSVYGSVALQALTGLPYVTAKSDIDLLFQPATQAQLLAGLRLLSAQADSLPLDGEILFPSGQAVAWKEWRNAVNAGSNPRVLVKEQQGVRLLKTSELLCSLEAEPCMN